MDAPSLGRVVVLVAEPGGGKTAFTKALRDNCHSHLFTASEFLIRAPGAIKVVEDELVIVDGLDEVARRRWGEGVAKVLERLDALGSPNALITCRAIEWDGAQYSSWIRDIYGEDPVTAYFVPFSFDEQVDLVRTFDPDIDAREFLVEAQRRDLGEMLGNPESLRLLLSSVEGGIWPSTRAELFERATYNATQETNVRRKSQDRIDGQRLVEAAGEVFASVLLSGLDGVDLVQHDISGFQFFGDFGGDDLESHKASLDTRLFRSHGGTSLVPAHRMVAEYVGARWLAARLNSQQISDRRLNAVIAPDGFVRTDLRGMHAWLATLGHSVSRRRAIDRDPYGVLRYGDPTGFSVREKRQLLQQLGELAEDDPYFQAAEGWTRPLIAGFFDPAMRDEVMAMLTASNRKYHLSSLILAAMRGSEFASVLAPDLFEMASDENRPYGERSGAVEALQSFPEIDFSTLVDCLRKRRTNDSARLALEIVSDRKGKGLEPVLVADALADAMLLNADDRDADLSTRDYAVVRDLPASILESVLDKLSERMAFMCDGSRRYRCNCSRALSPTVFRLVERRFHEGEQFPTADQLWRWVCKTYISQGHRSETETASAALISCDLLRRGVQERALRDRGFEENSWMALWRLRELLNGLQLTVADIVHHMEQAVAAGLSLENITLWTNLARWGVREDEVRAAAEQQSLAHSELAEKWEEITRPVKPSYAELRHMAWERRYKRKAEADKRERSEAFSTVREQVRRGSHVGWLIDIAKAYLGLLSDIAGDTPEARLADLLGEDEVDIAISGLCAALRRDDLPTLSSIAETASEGKCQLFELVICAGILAHAKSGGQMEAIPLSTLESARASSFFEDAIDKEQETLEAVEAIVFANKARIESFARGLFEPQIAKGREFVRLLILLRSDHRFSFCAAGLALEWLDKYSDMSRSVQHELFEIAVVFGDRAALIALVRRQCTRLCQAERNGLPEELDAEERGLWICAAFLLDFERHRSVVAGFAEETRDRLWFFRGITARDSISHRSEIAPAWPRLGVAQNRFLLEAFAEHWPKAHHPQGGWTGDTNPWDAHEFLRRRAQAIGSSNEFFAGEALDALIENPALSHHHDELRHLRAGWRRRRREAALEVPSFGVVREIFVDGPPKSVTDLQAMMIDALQWLQGDIQDGDTKGWLRFWNSNRPQSENDCRDHILDRIRHRFESVNVQLRPECRMPNDKRADIVASLMLGGDIHDLPVEIKCQWHKDIWTAAVAQLNERYARYVNAQGRGVYLVLWFGSVPRKNLKRRNDGKELPTEPELLRQVLIADLPEELIGPIDVFVLDVSRLAF